MRYRQLDKNGDYTFGQGLANFLIDDVEAVAQAILTRLKLDAGQWFLDLTEGLPLYTQIVGRNTGARSQSGTAIYDQAIRKRVLGTQGVVRIVRYSSNLSAQRRLTVEMTVQTIYGPVTLTTILLAPETKVLGTELAVPITTDTGAEISI